ncbi:anthrone oxygenase family protein [Kitasatospora sp. NPDC049285]|uniref:anthrone oxygenase family protein n=1 Tax=Kitasatospora sp. NPDC049285 TaxID=3157096 RepID=UPI0034197285
MEMRTGARGIAVLRTVALVGAVLTTGLSAGLFYSYACSVMPGLAKVEDRAFVDTMQRINVAILNGWFMLTFLGALVLIVLAGILQWRGGDRTALPWIGAAAVLYLVMLVITGTVNVPLNDKLAAAGAPDRLADPAAVRAAFEDVWVRWNVVRAVASTAAFGCLTWALVVAGRSSAV